MRRDHQAIWAALGGTIVTAGAAGVIGLLIAKAQIAPDPTSQRWWQFSMAAAVITAAIGTYIVVASLFVASLPLPRLRETDEAPAPVPTPPPVIVTIPTTPAVLRSQKRNLLNMTPAEIVRPFSDHTTIHAQQVVAAYKGQWIRVSGDFGDASPYGD